MRIMLRVTLAAAATLSLGGCALLGGGPKPPPTLLTLTPAAAAPQSMVRSANAGEANRVTAKSRPLAGQSCRESPRTMTFDPRLRNTVPHLWDVGHTDKQ